MTTPTQTLSHPKYRADIDGLRSVAVLSVVAFHAAPELIHGGFIGVDIFFVISGFLISTIIFSNLENNTFSLREFYARRIKRIFPALLLVLAATYTIGWWVLLADEFAQLGKHITAGALFVSNFALWNEAGYFDIAAETKPLLHLWSLGIEEQFYIIWPVLLIIGWRRKYNLLSLTLAFGTISMMLNLKGIGKNPTATFYSPQTRFWELLCGSLLAWFTLHPHPIINSISEHLNNWTHHLIYRGSPPKDNKTLANLRAIAGAGLIAFGLSNISAGQSFPGKWAVVPAVGTILIISAGPKAWLNHTILSSRLAIKIGLISFPLYLWHWPLLSYARIMEEGLPRADIRLAAVALAIVLAWLTYHFIERPLRFGKQNKFKITSLGFLMLCIGVLGFYTFSQNGLVFRMNSHINQTLWAQTIEPLNTRLSDGSCERLLNFSIGPDAVCLTTSPNPEVLVVGDSHAMALNSAALLGKVPVKTMLIGLHGCLPLVGYSIQDGKLDKGCNALSDQAIKVLNQYPSIRTVVIASRGPLYFSGQGYGIEGPSNYSIVALNGTTPTNQADMFRKGYSQLANKLLPLNKEIIFVIDPPELGEDPRGCLFKRPVSILDKAISTCTQDKQKVIDRQKIYREQINKIQADNHGVKIYDPMHLFCDSQLCYGLRDGKLLYWDDDHISVEASALVLNDMRRQDFLH
ncbi:MAG: acyltransferase [Burkholderiales bacterium]|nr:acyltransferase [Burkholderiales bacterium]